MEFFDDGSKLDRFLAKNKHTRRKLLYFVNGVSVQRVESLGGHFATLCQEFDFHEVKKKYILLFFKKKGEILLHF